MTSGIPWPRMAAAPYRAMTPTMSGADYRDENRQCTQAVGAGGAERARQTPIVGQVRDEPDEVREDVGDERGTAANDEREQGDENDATVHRGVLDRRIHCREHGLERGCNRQSLRRVVRRLRTFNHARFGPPARPRQASAATRCRFPLHEASARVDRRAHPGRRDSFRTARPSASSEW